MPQNRIQFQQGLSLPKFLAQFGTEDQCEAFLEKRRLPTGYRSPKCEGDEHYVLRSRGRKVYQCRACRHQTSLITGTPFHSTKLPFTVWLLAIYFISQAKTEISALALKRHLGSGGSNSHPKGYGTSMLVDPVVRCECERGISVHVA